MNLDLRFYFSLFLRRLHYFLLFLALGTGIGVTLATVLPPVYQSQATLIMESEINALAPTTVERQALEQLQIIERTVLSRDTLIEMVNRLDIYADAEERLTADEQVADMRRRLSISTSGGQGRRGPVQAMIVQISFDAPTGILSSAVTNEVVTLMLEENVRSRTGIAGQNRAFFESEVARLDRELSSINSEILAFQEQNLSELPDSLDFRRSQQAREQERLVQLERDEARIRDQRATLVNLFETTGEVVSTGPAARQTPQERQLEQLQQQMATLLLTLAPTHPRVQQLERQIENASAAVAAQQGISADTSGADLQLTAFEIQLAQMDGELDYIDSQRLEILAKLDQLEASIAATPGNAVVLNALQRDYENVRVQYDQAVSRLAVAQTAEVVENQGGAGRLSIVENAVTPREPVSPNRPVVAAAGIGGGFLLGLGLIVLMELFNSAIRRPADLTNKLGITPLATLPNIRTRWEVLRRRTIIIAALLLALVALPAALYFVHVQITPLDILLNRILLRFGLPVI